MSAFRMKRVNEQVRCELSALIRKHLPVETYGLISVTEAEVSKDLKNATVFISSIGGAKTTNTVVAALDHIRSDLQRDLARKIIMKYTPHLTFKLDGGLVRGQHVVDLLDELNQGQKT